MKTILCLIFALLFIFLNGCAAVEQKYIIPSVGSGTPQAVINEEELVITNFVATIKGFCINSPECNSKSLVEPQLDNSHAVAKALFTITPYGLMTLPFADFKGRKIAVPAGRVGIVVNHKYRKVLSKEKILSVEGISNDVHLGWSCAGTEIPVLELQGSKELLCYGADPNMLATLCFGGLGSLYEIKYEHCEWDTVIWANLERDKEYIMKLSSDTLLAPDGKILTGNDAQIKDIPDTSVPVSDVGIYDESGGYIGDIFAVDEYCQFSIQKDEKPFIGVKYFDKIDRSKFRKKTVYGSSLSIFKDGYWIWIAPITLN